MKTIKKVKSIAFTTLQRKLGIAAILTGEKAVIAKEKFFKSIKRKVTLVTLRNSRQAFIDIALRHFDKLHNLKGKLIAESKKPKGKQMKESEKFKGCNLTFRQLKTNTAVMATRWIKYYEHFLKTGVVQKSTKRTGKGKRKTGGETNQGADTDKKSSDTASLNTDTSPTPNETGDELDKSPEVSQFEAISLGVEEYLGKKVVEDIETPYERDVVYAYSRYNNYMGLTAPLTKSQTTIKRHYKGVIDTASASCERARSTLKTLEMVAKKVKFK